jgi:hypothetical protein
VLRPALLAGAEDFHDDLTAALAGMTQWRKHGREPLAARRCWGQRALVEVRAVGQGRACATEAPLDCEGAHGRTRRSRAHGSPRRQCFCRCARDDQSRRLLCTPRNTQRHFWADAAGPTANLCVTVNEPRVRGSRRGVVQIILLASGPVVANTRPSGASGVDLVQRAGAASPVSAAARRTDPAARGMRGHGRGLRWGPCSSLARSTSAPGRFRRF